MLPRSSGLGYNGLMTVAELIEVLKTMPQDAVCLVYDDRDLNEVSPELEKAANLGSPPESPFLPVWIPEWKNRLRKEPLPLRDVVVF